ncbi:MAG: hypothetical protein WCS17_01100 [Prevotella sp.]|nr:hypothetical protein [Prevotella sp.]
MIYLLWYMDGISMLRNQLLFLREWLKNKSLLIKGIYSISGYPVNYRYPAKSLD